jgi:hypothetical protein
MYQRQGVTLSRRTMCDWMPRVSQTRRGGKILLLK